MVWTRKFPLENGLRSAWILPANPSLSPSTAANCSRWRMKHSHRPAVLACGPKPTASRPSTTLFMETNKYSTRALVRCLGLFIALCAASTAAQAALDTARIEELTGLKGTFNPEEKVFKVSAPRADLPVEVDGWTMPPFMG